MGGRQSFAQFQYTLQGDNSAELYAAAPQLLQALQKRTDIFADVTSDQQEGGLESRLVIDRPTAFRYGITPDQIETPSTTPSASVRSRRSTTPSTSTTW